MHESTDEQIAAIEAFHDGQHLAIQAGAGTGKTTTLSLLTANARRRGRYLAYNRATATDATARFPATVTCTTAHSLAYRALGHRYRHRLNAPRRPAWKTGQDLGITATVRIGPHDITPHTLSHTVARTITRFCHSADPAPTRHHIPALRGLNGPEFHAEFAHIILPFALQAWKDLQDPDQGRVRFDHDHYLKIWALTRPHIGCDFLLLDEAQDTNPVVEQVFLHQKDHAQLVMVGDSAQAIYGWRGARDVMTGFDGTQLALSRSFRFGPALAHEANRWLTATGTELRLTGSDTIPTTLDTATTTPNAVLCRTNVGAMTEILNLLGAGHRTALVGGGNPLRALALAARDLKDGRATTHPELVLFPTWGAVQDYAAHDPSGSDLQALVDLIDRHGTDQILDAVGRLHDESRAQVTVSTAHKAKGREWPNVKIAEDFHPPKDTGSPDGNGNPVPGPIDIAEARLAYVAITRARRHLNRGSLAWIDDHPDAPPPQAQPGNQ
ncbi:UvrD-helicase domain-containing protein [Streptomyces fildesensis]|uniref:UvrD-helicase domain-containing protein n=1 Tax=Streptomyces fildesensis TaxID=375757 RepID=UPI0018DFF28A|nr:UvrD-helicase domain-containing protein [Streptomyces fildesensis]